MTFASMEFLIFFAIVFLSVLITQKIAKDNIDFSHYAEDINIFYDKLKNKK